MLELEHREEWDPFTQVPNGAVRLLHLSQGVDAWQDLEREEKNIQRVSWWGKIVERLNIRTTQSIYSSNLHPVNKAGKLYQLCFYLQLLSNVGGENQPRAVAEFDRLCEVVGLEIFGVTWRPRHAHHLPPHQAVNHWRFTHVWESWR